VIKIEKKDDKSSGDKLLDLLVEVGSLKTQFKLMNERMIRIEDNIEKVISNTTEILLLRNDLSHLKSSVDILSQKINLQDERINHLEDSLIKINTTQNYSKWMIRLMLALFGTSVSILGLVLKLIT